MNWSTSGGDEKVHILSEDEQWKRQQYSILAPILAILGMCALLVNVYVLLSALFLKRSASINLWFSLSLAAVDTYAATMIVVNLFLQSYLPIVSNLEPHRCILIVAEMLRLGGLISSVLHLLALAFTHFLGVAYPLRQHAWILARNRRVAILFILWSCPSAALFVCMSAVPGQAFLSPACRDLTFASEFPFRLAVCAAVALPMLTTFGFYFAILWKLKVNDRDPVLRDARPTRHNKKLLCTMILLMGTFLLGWCPSLLLYFLYCDNCPSRPGDFRLKTVTAVAVFVQLLIILKLFSNPLIYALRIGELRYALCQLNRRLFGAQFFALDATSSSMQQQQQVSRPYQSNQQRTNQREFCKTSCPNQSSSARRSTNGSLSLERQRFIVRFD